MGLIDGAQYFGLALDDYRRSERPPRPRQPAGLKFTAAVVGLNPPPALDRVSKADPLPARVDHGRWIVDCPCHAASMVWLDTPLVWCGGCGNAHIFGQWQRVKLPEERAEIEAALIVRPDAANRNWFPGESVENLLAENAAMLGVEN